MTNEELKNLIRENIVNTNAATQMLNCTRQNIDDLVKRKKLVPIVVYPRDKIFLKADIIERKEKQPK